MICRIIVICVSSMAVLPSPVSEAEIVYPVESDAILHNPLSGLVMTPHELYESYPANRWWKQEPLSRMINIRITWSSLEPQEGQYNWQPFDRMLDSWSPHGYKALLRVMAMSTDNGTPQWVYDAGAQYIDFSDPGFREPVYWDPVFLAKTHQFIQAFSQRYVDDDRVVILGLGHTGRWGEMHLDGRPFSLYEDAGYTPQLYLDVHKQITDWYLQAFPGKTIMQPLSSPMDVLPGVVQYDADNGVWLRQDGLYCNSNFGCGSPDMKQYYDQYYTQVGTSNELCFCDHTGSQLYDIYDHTINHCHVSILFANCFWHFIENADESMKNAVRHAARYAGYRYVIQEADYSSTLFAGSGFNLRLKWINQGAALNLKSYGVLCALLDGEGQAVWESLQMPPVPTNDIAWDRNHIIDHTMTWQLSHGIASGVYELRVGLQDPDNPAVRLQIANQEGDDMNRYLLGDVYVYGDDPIILNAAALSGSVIELGWNDPFGSETGYVVERQPYQRTDQWTVISELPADSTSYTDTDSIFGYTTYTYRVGAVLE